MEASLISLSAKNAPKAKTEYAYAIDSFGGGLNLLVGEDQIGDGESGDMVNLVWKNGVLCSRRGQDWLNAEAAGTGYAAFARLWHGMGFCHCGGSIYMFSPVDGTRTELCSGIPENRGTFFLYDDKLLYKNAGSYKEITYSDGAFACADVTPYVPVIIINAAPSTGAGDTYQPENRYSPRKTVWYNAESGVVSYYLPVCAKKIIDVYVDGVRTTAFSYNSQKGLIKFNSAPPVTDPPTNNTVKITYELANEEAQASVDGCRYVETYGGTGGLCVVMAGYEAQPNLILWNGQDSVSMNAGYFPMSQYQLCGSADEPVTGFGKQQYNLIIFKQGSIGKTQMETVTLSERLSIDLAYTPVNAKIGCEFPWSIQLVENNLVWANRTGVYTLTDTSSANENAVVSLSRKVNGNAERHGLLYDLEAADAESVCSFDDDRRYCLTAAGKSWVLSYEDDTAAWFPQTGTDAVAYITEGDTVLHLNGNGQLTALTESCSDYGEGFERRFQSRMLFLGSVDKLKNINTVLFRFGGRHLGAARLSYLTDYEVREDLTPLAVVTAEEYESWKEPGTRPAKGQAVLFRRNPMCRRVTRFAFRLTNETAGEDLELQAATVYYNHQGRIR